MIKMPTYGEIHAKIREIYSANRGMYGEGNGPNVKNCHIAHAKEILGVSKRPRVTTLPRKYPCPAEKLPLIETAFRLLGMIKR